MVLFYLWVASFADLGLYSGLFACISLCGCVSGVVLCLVAV